MPDSTTTPQRRRIIFAESIWMDCITFTTLVAQLLGDTPAYAPDFAHLSCLKHGVKAGRGQRREVAHRRQLGWVAGKLAIGRLGDVIRRLGQCLGLCDVHAGGDANPLRAS